MSYANLRLMLADGIRTDYKASSKGNDTGNTPETLDMSKPGSMEWLKRFAL